MSKTNSEWVKQNWREKETGDASHTNRRRRGERSGRVQSPHGTSSSARVARCLRERPCSSHSNNLIQLSIHMCSVLLNRENKSRKVEAEALTRTCKGRRNRLSRPLEWERQARGQPQGQLEGLQRQWSHRRMARLPLISISKATIYHLSREVPVTKKMHCNAE